jgi:hypothetical protein
VTDEEAREKRRRRREKMKGGGREEKDVKGSGRSEGRKAKRGVGRQQIRIKG